MKVLHLIIILVIVAIAGAVGLIYYKTQQVDTSNSVSVEADFRQVKQLDANLNELVLKSRYGLESNYDRLARTVTLVSNIVDRQTLVFPNTDNTPADLAFRDFRSAIVNKIDLIENFKSHNSVLRNSIRYAPAAGDELISITESEGLVAENLLYRAAVKEVLEHSVLFTGSSVEKLKLLLPQIENIEGNLPDYALITAAEFLNHTQKAVDEKQTTDRYLSGILSSQASDRLELLQQKYNQRVQKQLSSTNTISYLLAAYAGVLLLGLVYLGLRLRGLYQNLDAEVNKQTTEIRAAYEQLKTSQEQLIQSEKMASIGQMVAGVAHEINTPLGYVSSNVDTVRLNVGDLDRVLDGLELISQQFAKPNVDGKVIGHLLKSVIKEYRGIHKKEIFEEISDLLKDSSYGLQEISELVSSLRDYSRLDRSATDLYDINRGLDATLKICGGALKGRVEIERQFGEIPEVECAPSKINQVFMNIINNAAQAIEGEGKITITTSRSGSQGVAVCISDNGCGMSDEIQQKIFDPFFTTKEVGEGTGLGMSIAYKIIKSHGGEIVIDSKPGKGSSFTVELPVRQQQAPALVAV